MHATTTCEARHGGGDNNNDDDDDEDEDDEDEDTEGLINCSGESEIHRVKVRWMMGCGTVGLYLYFPILSTQHRHRRVQFIPICAIRISENTPVKTQEESS